MSRVACAVSALISCPCRLPDPWDFHGLWAANRLSQKGRFHLTRPGGAILSLSQLEVILHILKATFLVVGQATSDQKLRPNLYNIHNPQNTSEVQTLCI